jgi:hypothetical protein
MHRALAMHDIAHHVVFAPSMGRPARTAPTGLISGFLTKKTAPCTKNNHL